MPWYDTIAKPSWAPAAPVFGVVWSILYPIIFVAYGYVIFRIARGEIPTVVLTPIVVNLIANFAFTPIQFGLRNNLLAAIDIVIVLITIAWSMAAIWPHSPWAAVALGPYLVWVSIATVLQLSIVYLNR